MQGAFLLPRSGRARRSALILIFSTICIFAAFRAFGAGDFLKSTSRSIGGAVAMLAAFASNTGAALSHLVAPFLMYSHFLNSPRVNHPASITRVNHGAAETTGVASRTKL